MMINLRLNKGSRTQAVPILKCKCAGIGSGTAALVLEVRVMCKGNQPAIAHCIRLFVLCEFSKLV